MNDNIGAPIGTQQSGPNGERRDSEVGELSPQAEASERSLSRRVSRETKNKPSSFYLYLLILFGAAFLMLLLAYFVQQRNNETVQSDLRSATASRQELVEDIQRLEGENLALRQDKEALDEQLSDLQRQLDELYTDSFWREKDLLSKLGSWQVFWSLEKSFWNKDYEACAQFFWDACKSNYYVTPAEAADRVEEIYWILVEKGVLNEEEFPLSWFLPGNE